MADVFLVVCCFLSFLSYSIEEGASALTGLNFEHRVSEIPHFVMFYGPRCERCKNMMSTWDDLIWEYAKQDKQISIVKVDCTEKKTTLCDKQNIKVYPTLQLYYEGVTKRYNGKRSVAEFMTFVNRLVFKEIDCTAEGGKCNQHNMKAFPTLKLFKDGKEINEYTSSGQALKDLDMFVISQIADHSMSSPTDSTQVTPETCKHVHIDHTTNEEPPPPFKEDSEDDMIYTYQLNQNNFLGFVSFGTRFVMFYSPQCEFAKNFLSMWEHLAKMFAETAAGPKIGKMDCTEHAEREICEYYVVPTSCFTHTLFKDGKIKEENVNTFGSLERLYRHVMNYHLEKQEL